MNAGMDAIPLRIPVDHFALEGALLRPAGVEVAPAVVVCHPHPQRGGDMHNNVVVAIESGLVAAGVAALPFNFRGVGGSGGAYEGGIGERADVLAAVRCAADRSEVDATRLGLAGYSFGALMAAAVAAGATPAVRALLLVSPPLRDDTVLAQLARLEIPVLLLAGSEDAACPSGRLTEITALPHVEVVVAQGVDHFWWGREMFVAQRAGALFRTHLVGSGSLEAR